MSIRSHRLPTRSALALAVVTLALHAMQAHAAPVSLSATSGAEAPQGTTGSTNTYGTSPSYASSYSYASDTLGQSNGNAFSNRFGAYAVQASSEGNALAFGQSGLGYLVTNTSSVAQLVTMSFYIYGGSVSTALDYGFTGVLDSGEYLESSYLARILVDNSQVWSSGAVVRRDDAGVDITTSGATLYGAYQDDANGFYAWSGAYYSIELGMLAAGESFDVVTELNASASTEVGTYIYDFGGGGNCEYIDGYGYAYGCECVVATDVDVQSEVQNVTAAAASESSSECQTTRFKGGARVFYGDPVSFDFESSAREDGSVETTFRLTAVGTVALPSTVWLAGLAVAGLLAQSARRRAR